MLETMIFKAAVKLPAGERAAYLDHACGANAGLRLEVEGLLRAHEQPGEFMHRPAIADMATDYRPGPERPGKRIGPYKLLQYLGEGGMGTVFLAEQSYPVRRMVALKIIKPGMDSGQVLARFEAERQALAIMDHPNIAKVYDAGATEVGLELPAKPQDGAKPGAAPEGQNGSANKNGSQPGAALQPAPESIPSGRPYFVMELVKGVPITEFCDKNKYTTRQRLELFIPVCNAIQHAHMKGVIHRDIKPSNVLIALYDGKPVPKVIDFGVAKAMSEPLTERTMFTQIGQVVGTFEYMSPEQATLNQLDIDTRSDIYSLGVLLYELLTGLTPLDKDRLRALALDQMLKTIREQEPVRPSVKLSSEVGALSLAAAYRGIPSSKLTGLLRGELDWIVMKCLERERNRRFVTAGSLAEDIERYLRNEPVQACPPSLAYRAQKAYRKHKLALAVAGVIAVTLLAATVVSAVFALNADRARRKAETAELETAKKHDIAEKAKNEAEAERDKNATMVKRLSATEEQRRRNQYDWDLQIMQTTFEAGRIGQMQVMLDRHAADLRGFEWNYWNKQIHNEVRSRKYGIAGEDQGAVPSKGTIAIRDSGSAQGFGGPGGFRSDITRWIMNDEGTRVACVSYEVQGETLIDPATKRPFPQRGYFVDVFDSADGRQLCHIPFITRDKATNVLPSVSELVLSHDGSKLAVGWSVTTRIRSQEDTTATRTIREGHLRVMDVATKNTLYEANFGAEPDGSFGPMSASNTPIFFPDGKRLALLVTPARPRPESLGAHVRIIDLQTQPGKEIGRLETAFINFGMRGTSAMAISPDGTRLAYVKGTQVKNAEASPANALMDYTLATVDAATGEEQHTWHFTTGATGFLSLAFSPDSSRLAAGHTNSRAVVTGALRFTYSLRDAQTGKELVQEATDLEIQTNPGGAILFNPSGKVLYLRNGVYNANVIGKVWAFHADTGKVLAGFDGDFTLGQHYFSADGTRLYHLDANAVVIRDALTGKALQTLRGHVQSITHLGLAPDGRTLASLDNTAEYKVWRTAPEQPIALHKLATMQSRGFSAPVTRLSPDGRYVVAVPEDEVAPSPTAPGDTQFRPGGRDVAQLALWDAGNGRMQMLPMRPITEGPKEVTDADGFGSRTPIMDNKTQFTSNSRFVCLLRYRNYINRGGRPITNTEKNEAARAEDLSRYNFCDLTVWDTATGQETAYLQPSFDEISRSTGYSVSLSPDGKTVVLGSNGGVFITAYDLVSGRKLWSKAPDKNGRGLAVGGQGLFMSPDGKTTLRLRRIEDAEGRATGRVLNFMTCELLETATGNLVRSFEIPYDAFNNVVWSPDGKRIAVFAGRNSPVNRASNKLLRVYDLETGKLAMSLDAPPGGNAFLTQVMFSPDPEGRRIAGRVTLPAGSQANIKLWDSATGTELLSLSAEPIQPFTEFAGNGGQLAFSADGYRIVEFIPRRLNRQTTADRASSSVRHIDATPVTGK